MVQNSKGEWETKTSVRYKISKTSILSDLFLSDGILSLSSTDTAPLQDEDARLQVVGKDALLSTGCN